MRTANTPAAAPAAGPACPSGGAECTVSISAGAGPADTVATVTLDAPGHGADAAGAASGSEALGAVAAADAAIGGDAAVGDEAGLDQRPGRLAAPRHGIQRSGSKASASAPSKTSNVAQNTGLRWNVNSLGSRLPAARRNGAF